jgi:hypothetical protein
VFEYRGTDPADPAICSMRTNRVAGRTLFNIGDADHQLASQVRDGLVDLFPLAVGKSARFSTSASSGGVWSERFSVKRQEKVTVPAGTYDVYVIERTQAALLGNFEMKITYWWATNENIIVKKKVELYRGNGTSHRSYVAEKVVIPGTKGSE